MTPEEIKELRELEAKAASSPWGYWTNGFDGYVKSGIDGIIKEDWETYCERKNEIGDKIICGGEPHEGFVSYDTNIQLLIAARNALPKLLDEIEMLQNKTIDREVKCPSCNSILKVCTNHIVIKPQEKELEEANRKIELLCRIINSLQEILSLNGISLDREKVDEIKYELVTR